MKVISNAVKISCEAKDFLNLDELQEFQGNLKERNESDIDKICGSIKKYGFSFPFFVWKDGEENKVLDGHGRLSALKRLDEQGYMIPPLPVVYVDCEDEKSAKDLLLRLNSQYGKMTKESVLEFIGGYEFNADDYELPSGTIEFESDEEPPDTKGDDEVPAETENVVSKTGEMYELGNSILMCGDSTNGDDVSRLMSGFHADICFTSPPYNMMAGGIGSAFSSKKVEDSYGIGKGTYDEFTDDLSDEKYQDLLCKSLGLALVYCDDVLFNIGILDGSKKGIIGMLGEYRNNFSDILVWNKTSCMPLCLPTQIHLVNHICELIFCFNQSGNRSFSHSQWKLGTMSNRIDTSNAAGKNEYSKVHHAVFPVEFPEYVIRNFTDDSVLDLFGGTGTTLIAAEKLGRKARMMEMSPMYCDIIRKRYTKWAKENGRPLTSGCIEEE